MSDKYFLDTNIFVYSFDATAPAKRTRALELIQDAIETGLGVISTQVMQEFLNAATRKFTVPLTSEDATLYLQQVLNPLCHVYPDLALYKTCLEIQAETGYSFYDSLMLAGSIRAGCTQLLSEDLQHGQVVRGVTIENPFL
jgi:predicted nucleic acid-binding protein